MRKYNHFELSINVNNSAEDNNELYVTNKVSDKQSSKSKTQKVPSIISSVHPTSNETDSKNDDCFIKLGLISSVEEKNKRINARNLMKKMAQILIQETGKEEDQPAFAVEEIDVITAVMIYNVYFRKHKSMSTSQCAVSEI